MNTYECLKDLEKTFKELKMKGFHDNQMFRIFEGFHCGLNSDQIRIYADPQIHQMHMYYLEEALCQNIPEEKVKLLSSPLFYKSKNDECKMSFLLTIIKSDFSLEQLKLIINPKMSIEQMEILFQSFHKGMKIEDVNLFANHAYTKYKMECIRDAIIDNMDKEKIEALQNERYESAQTIILYHAFKYGYSEFDAKRLFQFSQKYDTIINMFTHRYPIDHIIIAMRYRIQLNPFNTVYLLNTFSEDYLDMIYNESDFSKAMLMIDSKEYRKYQTQKKREMISKLKKEVREAFASFYKLNKIRKHFITEFVYHDGKYAMYIILPEHIYSDIVLYVEIVDITNKIKANNDSILSITIRQEMETEEPNSKPIKRSNTSIRDINLDDIIEAYKEYKESDNY